MKQDDAGRPPDELMVAAVEAVLFAAGEPVLPKEIAAAFGGIEEGIVLEAVDALREAYDRDLRGLRVEQVAGGFRIATRSDVGAWVRHFFRQRNRARLSPAALETLAIVAYRQPITAPEIQAIRGVDPAASIKSLLEKKMIRILGKKRVVGNPLLYGTSRQFLIHFGLNRLEDLPSIDEFEQFLGSFEGTEGAPSPVAEDRREDRRDEEGPEDDEEDVASIGDEEE